MMIIFFSFRNIFSASLLIQKLRKSSCLGSLTIPSPLAFCWRAFYFLNYFPEKEGFLIERVEYNQKFSSIYYFHLNRAKRGGEEKN